MPHPLDGARKRVKRADKHLREIITELGIFRQRQLDGVVVQRNKATGLLEIRWPAGMEIEGFELMVSDCIHNFRAALDYIIYELARVDAGQPQNGTQFPIEDTQKGFIGRSKTYLKGLTREHIDAVESYQPYKGVQWTKTLRTYSNPDKHRHLVLARGDWNHDWVLTAGEPGSFQGRPGKIFKGVGDDGSDVYMEGQYSLIVSFEDGPPLIETLEIFKSQVSATVEAFNAEF